MSELGTSGAMSPSSEAPGIFRILRVLRERWWVIALCALLCTGAAVARSVTQTKQYEATSKLLFTPNSLAAEAGGASEPTDVDPEGTKATNVLLVATREVAGAVREELRLDRSIDDLLAQMTVETESTANIVDVTARDASPELAAGLANTWAAQFKVLQRERARADVREGITRLEQRIAQTDAGNRVLLERLNDRLSNLASLEALQTGDVTVVDTAPVPGDPVSPKPLRDAFIALLLGTALGTGLAFLLNLLDRRVRTVEDLEGLYGFRAVTSVPLRTREPVSQRDRQAALEPFRILRGGLTMAAGGREVRVVLVTSAIPGEGKSTTSAGLARAVALSGQSVALVEADLRRPTFQQQFDLGGDPRGLTTALVGGVPVGELLRPVLPGLRTLTILPSGPVPPNSAELLRSPEFAGVLGDLLEEVDVVILDAPPLLPVADAQVLLDNALVDVTLIVGRAYHTNREDARRARAVIERHRQRRLGLVVNGLRDIDAGYQYYGAVEDETGAARLPA